MSASVVLTGTVLPDSNVEREIVDAAGGDLEIIDVESSAELIESATDPVGIMTIETPIDEAVLDAFPNLEFVSVHGIGVDMVDVDAATERGIPVFNTPEYCVEEVATHTLGLILACQRRICQFNADVKSGEWDYGAEGSIRRLSTKTVGVVGLGAIGCGGRRPTEWIRCRPHRVRPVCLGRGDARVRRSESRIRRVVWSSRHRHRPHAADRRHAKPGRCDGFRPHADWRDADQRRARRDHRSRGSRRRAR